MSLVKKCTKALVLKQNGHFMTRSYELEVQGPRERMCKNVDLAWPLPQLRVFTLHVSRRSRVAMAEKLAGLELALLYDFGPCFVGADCFYLKPYGFTHYSLHEEG